MNFVIIGDSLTLPRIKEYIFIGDTYPKILEAHFKNHYLVNLGKYRNDTKLQSEDSSLSEVISYHPDLVVIHLGIVDCAPRLFSRSQQRKLETMPALLKTLIVRSFSLLRYSITKFFPKTYVKKGEFYFNLKKITKTLKSKGITVILVNIANTSRINNLKSYNFFSNIQWYNEIISQVSFEENCTIVDMYSKTVKFPQYLLEDGIHLSKSGHQELSKLLIGEIEKLIQKK